MNIKLKIMSFLVSEGATEITKLQVYKTKEGVVNSYQAYYTKDEVEYTCMFDTNGETDGGSVKVDTLDIALEEIIVEEPPVVEEEETPELVDSEDELAPHTEEEEIIEEVIAPQVIEDSIEDDIDTPDAVGESVDPEIIPEENEEEEPKDIPEHIQLEADITGIPVEFLLKASQLTDRHY
jgi:hypothetical protein